MRSESLAHNWQLISKHLKAIFLHTYKQKLQTFSWGGCLLAKSEEREWAGSEEGVLLRRGWCFWRAEPWRLVEGVWPQFRSLGGDVEGPVVPTRPACELGKNWVPAVTAAATANSHLGDKLFLSSQPGVPGWCAPEKRRGVKANPRPGRRQIGQRGHRSVACRSVLFESPPFLSVLFLLISFLIKLYHTFWKLYSSQGYQAMNFHKMNTLT